jgi:hypothetical protein
LQTRFLKTAVIELHRTLEVDSENATAHYLLQQLYDELGETALSEKHEELHDRYRPDDNAQGQAVRLAREQYPEASKAAESVVIYPLTRPRD